MTVLMLCLYFSSIEGFFILMFIYSFIYFTITGYDISSAPTNTTANLFYSNCAGSEVSAVYMFLQQSHFEDCCWSWTFFLVLQTERKFMPGNSRELKFSYQKRRVFSVYLLLLLPSQGGWHRSSDWQSADLGRTKKKKSQQCVCHQNTCDISTISKAEEIMGSFLYISQFHLQSGFFTSTYVNGLMLQNYTID